MKPAKILFFVDGVAPTQEDYEAASKLTAQVVFRNARAVPSEGALEECDGVAGHVPAPYAELPAAEEAIKAHAAKLAAQTQLTEDRAAHDRALTQLREDQRKQLTEAKRDTLFAKVQADAQLGYAAEILSAHFISHHSKAFAVLTRTSSLDGSVQ